MGLFNKSKTSAKQEKAILTITGMTCYTAPQASRNPSKAKKAYNMETIPVSGSQKIAISPQISYSINPDFIISGIFHLPVYQYYNQQQLASTWSLSVSVTKKFSKRERAQLTTP